MSDSVISIVMPTYNAAKFIHQTIQSVLNQSLSDFEYLILDDGSSDRSLAIAREYELGDRRIQVFSHPNLRWSGFPGQPPSLTSEAGHHP